MKKEFGSWDFYHTYWKNGATQSGFNRGVKMALGFSALYTRPTTVSVSCLQCEKDQKTQL